jgi:predicted phosphodiesterase
VRSLSVDHPLRERLYQIGRQDVPESIWQWFFRYFARGMSIFDHEPRDMLENYKALFQMAIRLLNAKYTDGSYAKFIKDTQTPNYTYYFIGDTHGSFQDTYIIIDYLIRVFQATSQIKVVWIGDFVDRNPYDLQNLAFIVSLWILFPHNIFLLRGNHEDSSVCSRYGFSQHLYEKAGSKQYFQEVWDLVIQFFSKLPIGMYSRIGNQNVWTVHGGIPFDLNNYQPLALAQIEDNLKCFTAEYFDMDPYSVSMLWSDPDDRLTEGVIPNPHNGRPRFSRRAFEDFMQLNHLDILIRGHEKWTEGYHLYFDNRLVSLFSTSTYDGKSIGEAKFLRFLPDTEIGHIGEETRNKGQGILAVEPGLLENQLTKHYNVKI